MFFSIITVSLNAEKLIGDTLKSALSQTFTDFEIIVKDGGSKDNTLACIPKDSKIRVISIPDKGIYEGMNQAIKEAKGKYLIFMNCGDLFYDETVLEKAYNCLKDIEPCILYGKRFSEDIGVVDYPVKITKRHFYYSTVCHQASFIPKEAFEKIGYYDESLKITSDWKFFLDAYIGGIPYVYNDNIVCSFLSGGVSETEKGIKIAMGERKGIIKTRFSFIEKLYIPILHTKLGQILIGLKQKNKG